MASRTAEAQHRVAAQRARIEQRMERLNGRIHDDLEAVRNSAATRKDDAIDRVPGRQAVQDFVQERPLSALFGALGSGVALGIASESLPSIGSMRGGSESSHDRGGSQRERSGGSESSLQRLLGPALANVVYPMQDEFRSWMRDILSNRKPTSSSGRRNDGAASSDTSDEQARAQDAGTPARAPDPVGAR